MGHAVDFTLEADEKPELGDVLDLALDLGIGGVQGKEGLPRVILALFEAQRDAAFFRVRVEHHDLDFLAGGNDLAGVGVLFIPAHLGHVHQPLHTRLQFDESAVIGNVGDPTRELGARGIFFLDPFPGIGLQLFHAQRNTLGFGIEADHLHLHGLADLQGFGRVIDAAPSDIGDMQKAVDAAQVHKSPVIGDVLDHAFENLALGKVGNQFRFGFGAGFLQHGAARYDDVVALRVHFQDLERLRRVHHRGDVADRADIHLASGQECHRARQIDDEAALDAAENDAVDTLALVEGFIQLPPGFLALRLFAAEADDAVPVFVAFDEDIDGVAGIDLRFLAGGGELLQRHAALGFEADVDQHLFAVDGDHRALDDAAFEFAVGAKGFFQQVGETFLDGGGCVRGRGRGIGGLFFRSHEVLNPSLFRFQANRLGPVVLG